MPTYKLIYLRFRGGGEVIRLIFAQAGVKYEDVGVSVDGGEQWNKLTSTTPFGVLPMLEVDGKKLGGSRIIARYLAELELFGLAGENPFENAQITNIADAVDDLDQEMIRVWIEKDKTRKAEMQKKLEEEIIPTKLQFFERRASTNVSDWLFGKLTWADFFLYLSLEWALKLTNNKALNHFPGLTKMRTSVEALPNIAKWLNEHPVIDC